MINEGQNGLSYDFGIMIAQGTVGALTKTVAAATALAGTIYALSSSTEQMDDVFKKNQVAMGGYTNTLKAMNFVSQQVASGASYFAEEDIFAGIRLLNRAGIDAKKNFDLINKAASATGNNFTEMAGAVQSGSFSALAEAGIITDRMAYSWEQMGLTAQQSSKKILAMLQQANAKGLFDNTIQTFPAILARFREFGKQFVRAIIGDPKDPEGFAFTVKKVFTEIADFIYTKLNAIRAVGMMIGKFLTFAAKVTWDFTKRIAKNVGQLFNINDKFFENFQKKMLSLGLWLEIVRVKISSFFDEHGEKIKFFGKLLLGYLAFRYIDEGILKILPRINTLTSALNPRTWKFISDAGILKKTMEWFDWQMMKTAESQGVLTEYMKTGATTANRMGNILLQIAKNPLKAIVFGFNAIKIAAMESAAVMMANPLFWVAAAVAALIAIVYYWDEIRQSVSGVSDGVLMLISFFSPAVGLIMNMAKYWTEIKTIMYNIGAFLYNNIMIAVYKLKKNVQLIGNFIGHWLNKLGPVGTFFKTIWGYVKDIWDWFNKIFDSDIIKRGLNWLADVTGKAADSSAAALAQESGNQNMGVRSTTVSAEAQKEMTALRAKNVPEEKIKAQLGANYTPPTTALTSKAPQPPMPPSGIGNTSNFQGAKTVNVHSGAVQINLSGSNVDADQLAQKVKRILEEMGYKDDSRKGR